jgi:putative peptidoglycan lipid II flippase
LAGLVVLTELGAPWIAGILGRGLDSESQQLATTLLRLMLPSVFFLSMSGILTGLLYALKRFALPAFTSSIFNASIVIAALALGSRLGVMSMAMGILAGSVLQIALQLPGLRGLQPRWNIDWRHPGLRRLARLYGPVAASLIISQAAIYLSLSLASLTGASSIAWMNYATTLIQFPLGLVATAVSVAILPTLSQQASEKSTFEKSGEFMATLAHGLKLVLLLIVPATVGLFVLAQPIIGLLFEHGQFSPNDTLMTVQVLRFYLPGLTFAAIDLPLIYAFYARKDTLTPALVGLACIFIYLVAALTPTLFRQLHVTDLALANSIQWISHALIMLVLLARRVGTLHSGVLRLTIKALGSSLLMGGATLGTVSLLQMFVSGTGLSGELFMVASSGGIGLVVYVGLIKLLKVEEIDMLWQLVRRRIS